MIDWNWRFLSSWLLIIVVVVVDGRLMAIHHHRHQCHHHHHHHHRHHHHQLTSGACTHVSFQVWLLYNDLVSGMRGRIIFLVALRYHTSLFKGVPPIIHSLPNYNGDDNDSDGKWWWWLEMMMMVIVLWSTFESDCEVPSSSRPWRGLINNSNNNEEHRW